LLTEVDGMEDENLSPTEGGELGACQRAIV
jgi:hypothetical protein